MPDDQAVASPPAAPLPNPAIPSNFNPAVPFAQSALERSMSAAALQSDNGQPHDYDSRRAAQALEEARARDRGQAPAQPQQGQQPAPAGEPDLLRPRTREVRRSADWEAVNKRAAAAEAKAKELEARLAGQPSQPDAFDITKIGRDALSKHPDWAKLQAERDTYYEEVKHTRVEADPEFRSKYETKTNAILNAVKRVSGKASEDIMSILSDTNADRRMAALAERIKDFGDGTKTQLIAAASQLAALDIERDIEISTRKATWEQTQSARQAQQASVFDAKLAKMNTEFEHVWQEACHPENGLPFLLDDKIKARVLPDARRIFSGESDARSLATAALHAAILPDVIRSAQAAYQEIERLRHQMNGYAQAWPGDEGQALNSEQPAAALAPVNPAGYDRHFGSGLEAARARDGFKGGY